MRKYFMKKELKEKLKKLKKGGKTPREIFEALNKDEKVFNSLSEVRRISTMIENELELDRGVTVSHDDLFVTDKLIEDIEKGKVKF